MRRRAFLRIMGGLAAWPLAARAQQRSKVRQVGLLMPHAQDDPSAAARIAALRTGLRDVGWSEGKDIDFVCRADEVFE